MNDESVLRRRVNLLLRAYPPGYRSGRGEEIAATMLDMAEPSQTWPSVREVGAVLLGAARVRGRSTDLTPSTLVRHALQLAVVGVTVPLVVYNFWSGALPHTPLRGQVIAWAVPYVLLVGGLVAASVGAYGTGLAILVGTYALQHWRDSPTVDTIPIDVTWSTTFYIPGALLVVLLLWRLADRPSPRTTGRQLGRVHRAPTFSVVTMALITAVFPLLDRTLHLPADVPWWQFQLRNFAPYLILLAFAWIDPRIALAGAALAILSHTYLVDELFGPDQYPQHDRLKAALLLGGTLTAASVLAAAGALARWRLSRH
jgi:hypothetical protein